MRFRKKPVVIEAFQFGVDTPPLWWKDAVDSGVATCENEGRSAQINTLEGTMTVSDHDWIIQGVNGELYPCKPDIFAKTYEAVND